VHFYDPEIKFLCSIGGSDFYRDIYCERPDLNHGMDAKSFLYMGQRSEITSLVERIRWRNVRRWKHSGGKEKAEISYLTWCLQNKN
jgi:hypothetical protein